ncbi:MAG: carboxypeptidase-like regulatory domain-containing protein [Bryobacteraceae bacterium]|nr:carboxypeptidase-like regulatory domain-containing protein [Bryobacteraceae bacterium]
MSLKVIYMRLRLTTCFFVTMYSLAQPEPGSIIGSVRADDGTPIAGAEVTMARAVSSELSKYLPNRWLTRSREDGTFSFDSLPVGSFGLCATVPGSNFLDSCEWREPVPVIRLERSHTVADVIITLKRGAEVQVRVDDDRQLLALREGRVPGASLLIGVGTPSGTFQPAILINRASTFRVYKVVIPYEKDIHLIVNRSMFRLVDSAGNILSRSALIRLRIVRGAQTNSVRLSVIGEEAL